MPLHIRIEATFLVISAFLTIYGAVWGSYRISDGEDDTFPKYLCGLAGTTFALSAISLLLTIIWADLAR